MCHPYRRFALRVFRAAALAGFASGCATTQALPSSPLVSSLPTLQGSYHRVQPGETLWRIARSFGVSLDAVARANRLPNASQLEVGQQLFIPMPDETAQFLWPVRGQSSRLDGGIGVTIRAPQGSLVRASRSGRVAVAAQRLSGWGKTVVLEHGDGHLSLYTGLHQVLVQPGMAVRQGVPVGNLGEGALYFEIRYGSQPRDALALLPRER